LAESFLVAEQMADPTIEAPPQVSRLADQHDDALDGTPSHEAATFTPDAHDFAGLELVYDDSADRAEPRAPPPPAETIAVPRYVLYVQGGLLAAVALTAFIIGVLMGSSFGRKPLAAGTARECVVTGAVTYSAGPRSRPDRGAVIAFVPLDADAAFERAPVGGLRPSDPPPEADHAGLGAIRQLGGSYTRADANGRFETRLPAPGRYWLLVVSHEKRARAAADTTDVRALSRFFENAADLLEDRTYKLSQETIRGDRQLTVAFE